MVGVLSLVFVMLVIVIWVLSVIIYTILAAFRHSWQESIYRLFVLVLAIPLTALAFLPGDYVHLMVMYPAYAQTLADNQLKETTFYWGGIGFAGSATIDRFLVYDHAGKLDTEIGSRRLNTDPTFWVQTRHLIGHFYIRMISG